MNVLLVMFLVLLNGFFVAAEFAMVKVRSTRIEMQVLKGSFRAKCAQKLVMNLDAYLSACQLGITLASLGLGWVGEPMIAKMIQPMLIQLGFSQAVVHPIAFAIAFTFITFLHIVLGELAPKSMAIQKSEGVTLWTALPLIAFYRLMYPFIWLLNGTANGMLRKMGLESASAHEGAHTEEEIRILLEESHKFGLIDNTELALVDKIFDFSDRNAREIMIPRTDMVCLYAQSSFEENLDIAVREQMTRYPVCDPDKDHIIGFVHVLDLFEVIAKKQKKQISEIIRSVITVPESMPINFLLKMMQKERAQLAVVMDEFGGTAGLLTIEDILEEIVGEIHDEFDKERESIEVEANDVYSVDGRVLLEEANDFFGLDIKDETIDTLGGWIYSKVQSPPKPNDRLEYNGYEMIVHEIDHLRITRVLIRKLQKTDDQLNQNLTVKISQSSHPVME